MKYNLTTLAVLSFLHAVTQADENWNQFRGPQGNGISTAKNLPSEFDEAKNVRWKIPIAGEGWSSPVVWDNEIWLTSGNVEERELRAICVDLESGKVLKDIQVFEMMERQLMEAYKHDSPHLNSPATPTPVVEEDRVFVHFGSQGVACLDRKTGDKIWQRRDLRIYQPVRQGSSPIVDDTTLYVAYDGIDKQFFVALDKKTGDTRWITDRNVETDWEATLRSRGFTPKKDGGGKPGDNKKSFATARLIEVNGQRQLIAPAAEATIAYTPETGDEIWRVVLPGGFNVAARPLYAHGFVYVFTSGLAGHLLAIRTDGTGDVTDSHVAWQTTKGTPHIPSPIIIDDLMFLVTNRGIARCLDAKTGEEIWRKRVTGEHWASPVYANGKLYFSSKQGEVTVMLAGRDVERIARNQLDGEFIASPAVVGESLILRSTTHLYCIAEGYERSVAEVAAERDQLSKKQSKQKGKVKSAGKQSDDKLAALGARLKQLVATGKLTKEEGLELYQLAMSNREEEKEVTDEAVDLEALGQKLKAAVAAGEMTAEEARAKYVKIANQQKELQNKSPGKDKKTGKKTSKGKKTVDGRTGFYAIVIGRLKSKDVELGEFVMEVDHVTSMYDNRWVKDEIVNKTVKVTGVSGAFLDSLLLIKRGETLKFRSGSYSASSNSLTFGPKFHVLERTPKFDPAAFGVPPEGFRGFSGILQGKIVELDQGYEVLLRVDSFAEAAENSTATDAKSIQGKLVKITGFFRHEDKFKDLHEGDTIRVGVRHANRTHDELRVTDVLEKKDGQAGADNRPLGLEALREQVQAAGDAGQKTSRSNWDQILRDAFNSKAGGLGRVFHVRKLSGIVPSAAQGTRSKSFQRFNWSLQGHIGAVASDRLLLC